MKRLFTAAAALLSAALPAAAGAVPPSSTGVPVGANSCFVVSTTAVPGTCNFTGGPGGIGYIGMTDDGWSLTHVRKVNVCTVDPTDGVSKVSGYQAQVVQDEGGKTGGSYTPYDFEGGPSYVFGTGIVYTFTVTGHGFGSVGGQTGPSTTIEPATPSAANNYAGADASGASPLGTLC